MILNVYGPNNDQVLIWDHFQIKFKL